jgi:ATP-dependent Clp protease adaptor protein ClpS
MADTKAVTITDIDVKKKPRLDLSEPSMYNVIYLNDEVTTVDFVIESLIQIFQYSQPDASGITEVIHTDGSAIVATLPYEIAEQKGVEVTVMARDAGFPLTVKLEMADVS